MLKRFAVLLLSVVLLLSLTACFSAAFVQGFVEGFEEGVGSAHTSSSPSEVKVSDKEILFNDIPWGSNPTTVSELMGEDMFLSKDSFVKNWDFAYSPYTTGSHQGGHILYDSNVEVAGYSVDATMYFLYSVDAGLNRSVEASQFYLASYEFNVVDLGATYDDLKKKLTALYGEGTEEIDTSTHYQVAVVGDGYSGTYDVLKKVSTWVGKNDTQVVLVCSILLDDVDVFTSEFLQLTYGKTDIDSQIEAINEAILEEKAQEEANNRDPSNTSGL